MEAREFEWESQLRFYWEQEPDTIMVQQCTGKFGFGYEYMGLNGRLVITPLTDRIYLTITQVQGVCICRGNCAISSDRGWLFRIMGGVCNVQ